MWLVACGGSSDVEGGQTVGDLTLQEGHALCLELQPYFVRSWSGDCTATALDIDPTGGATCMSERKACIDDSAGDCSMGEAMPSKENENCAAVRVDDFRDCVKASADLSERKFGKNVDCRTGVEMGPTPVVPAACNRVHAACSE
jgi:hypothetical protein